MAVNAHVYENDNAGGPVNLATPVADVAAGTYQWQSPALPLSSDTTFQVRNHDTVTGLEETNTDARVRIRLDAAGNDISSQPAAPVGLSVTLLSGGKVRVDWQYPPTAAIKPAGFHVYVGSPTVSYTTPAATVPYQSGAIGFTATLTGLLGGGHTYTGQVGVRAYVTAPTAIEEQNTNVVGFTTTDVGPLAVDDLTAIAVP